MMGLATAVFLILVNVCAALEHIEFKHGGRKIKVPLNRPIHVTNVKSADLVDFKFSIPKLVELLPFVAEDVYRTQPEENAPKTRIPGDAFSNRFKTKHQFLNENTANIIIKPNDEYNKQPSLPVPLPSNYLYTTHVPNNFRNPPSVDYRVSTPIPLHDHLQYSTQSPETMTHLLDLSNGPDSYDLHTLSPAANAAQSPYTTPAEDGKQPPLPESPLIQETRQYKPVAIPFPIAGSRATVIEPTQASSLLEKIPPISERLNSLTPLPLVPQVTSSSTMTSLRSYTTLKQHPVVTSPVIARIPLFPEWRLHKFKVTPIPDTTPVSATSPELNVTIKSDTTPAPVVPTERVFTSVLDTMPVSVKPKSNALVKSLSIASLPRFSAWTTITSMSDSTPLPVISPAPDMNPVTDTQLVPLELATTPVSDSLIAPVELLESSSRPLVSVTTLTSVISTESEMTATSKKTVLTEKSAATDLITDSNAMRTSVKLSGLDKIPVLDTTLLSGALTVSDTTVMPVTSPELVDITLLSDTMPVTGVTPVSVISLDSDMTAEINTTPVSDILPVHVTSTLSDVIPVSDTSPVLVTIKSVMTRKPSPLAKSPVIANIPLFPAWRLHKSIVKPLLDTTLSSDIPSVSVLSSEPDLTQVSDKTLASMISVPVTVTKRYPSMTPVSDTVIESTKKIEPSLVSETTLASLAPTESLATPVSDIMSTSVTLLETDLSTVSDKITAPVTIQDTISVLDTTLEPVTSLEPYTTLVEYTTQLPVISHDTEADTALALVTTSVMSPKSNSSLVLGTTIPTIVKSSVPRVDIVNNVASQVLSSPPVISKPITTPNLRPLVTSPLIASIPLFPEWRLLKTAATTLSETTPVADSTTLRSTALEIEPIPVSDTTTLLLTSPETAIVKRIDTRTELATSNLNFPLKIASIGNLPLFPEWKFNKSVVSLLKSTQVFDSKQDTSSESNTKPVSDTTLKLVSLTGCDAVLVSDTTPVLETPTESDTIPVSDMTLPLEPSSGAETSLELNIAHVLDTFTDTNMILESDTIPELVTSTGAVMALASDSETSTESDTTQVTQITLEPVTSTRAETALLSDTKPLLETSIKSASIPLSDPTQLLETSSRADASPESKTAHVLDSFTETDITPESDTLLELVTSTEAVMALAADSTPVPKTSTESDMTQVTQITLELVTITGAETALVSDTKPVLETSIKSTLTPASDPILPLETSSGAETSLKSDTVPLPEISTESDTTQVLETSLKLVTSLGAVVPVSDSMPVPETSRERSPLPVSDRTLELVAFIGAVTAPVLDTTPELVILPETETVKVSVKMQVPKTSSESSVISLPVPYLVPYSRSVPYLDTSPIADRNPEPVSSPETEKTPVSETRPLPVSLSGSATTQKSNTIQVPVTLVASGMTTMSDAASEPVTSHMLDTTPFPMKTTESETISVSDTMIGTTPLSETMLEAATCLEPESQLPDTALVQDTTVELSTSSVLFETTVAAMTKDLVIDSMVPVISSLGSETTASTLATVPSTSYSVAYGARLADNVTPSRSPIRTTKVRCVRRKSSKKKRKPGRQCLNNRALRHLCIHYKVEYKGDHTRKPPRYTITLRI